MAHHDIHPLLRPSRIRPILEVALDFTILTIFAVVLLGWWIVTP